ncbi:response regulator transcription factor [Phormidium sp. CCY1219]|uniref:response regulator transcription factor n=1 Tax=Phormidium sp. CCY1219 TaxID=2886104 RepID=UPI002D77FC77|nr:response regulator transcription factor [Phormidium sp. CCY1219]
MNSSRIGGFARKPDLQVEGVAENGKRALALVESLQPNVVLMDIHMPVMDGVTAMEWICEQFPEVKVLMLTSFDEDEYVAQALQVGVMGYLLKDMPSEELTGAIRTVDKGYTQVGPGLVKKVMAKVATPPQRESILPPGWSDLTRRELEVLQWLSQGASDRKIANSLYICEGMVKNHVTNILHRLNLRDRTQVAIVAHSVFSRQNPSE